MALKASLLISGSLVIGTGLLLFAGACKKQAEEAPASSSSDEPEGKTKQPKDKAELQALPGGADPLPPGASTTNRPVVRVAPRPTVAPSTSGYWPGQPTTTATGYWPGQPTATAATAAPTGTWPTGTWPSVTITRPTAAPTPVPTPAPTLPPPPRPG